MNAALGLALAAFFVTANAAAEEPAVPTTSVSVASDRASSVLFVKNRKATFVMVDSSVEIPAFTPLCVAPCTVDVPTDGTYVIAGRDTVASQAFHLPPGPKVDLRVDGGSLTARRWGSTLLDTGFIVAVLGVAFIVSGYITKPDPNDSKFLGEPNYLKDRRDAAASARLGGFITAPIGVLSMVVGGIMMATNHTHVVTADGVAF